MQFNIINIVLLGAGSLTVLFCATMIVLISKQHPISATHQLIKIITIILLAWTAVIVPLAIQQLI